MPSKTRNQMRDISGVPDIPEEFLDQVEKGPMTAEGVEAVMAKLKKALIERAMVAEMSHHLGYAPGEDKPRTSSIIVMAAAARRFSLTPVRFVSRSRVIGTVRFFRSSLVSTSAALPASTTRSSPCILAA